MGTKTLKPLLRKALKGVTEFPFFYETEVSCQRCPENRFHDTLNSYYDNGQSKMNNFEAKSVGEKPCIPITESLLRCHIELYGKENMMVTLIPVQGGYQFRTHANYNFKQSAVIQSENTKKIRTFKTVEAALNLARKFGFGSVAIELEPVETINKRYARTAKKPSSA
jgi:hypothetical protein